MDNAAAAVSTGAEVHSDRLRVLSTRPLTDAEYDRASSSHRYQDRERRDDSHYDEREPKRARADDERYDHRGDGDRRRWNDDEQWDRHDRRDDRSDDRRYGRSQRWERSERNQERERRGSSNEDTIRFLSTISLPDRDRNAVRSPPLSSSSSPFSPQPTAFVLLQALPAACDEAALHVFCHPFHCVRHRFAAGAAPQSPQSCVIEFSDRDWAKQFHVVHSDKLRFGTEQPPVHMEYVSRTYVHHHVSSEAAKAESVQPSRRPTESEAEQEDGEVDVELEETPAVRSARLQREYDLSSVSAAQGTSPCGGVLLVSALPYELQSNADNADVIRYAFAPFAPVRWVAQERLLGSGDMIAFVAFHSAGDAQRVFNRRADVRLLNQPVSVHYARKTYPAPPVPSSAEAAGAVAAMAASTFVPGQSPVRPSHLPGTYVYQEATGYWLDSATGLFYHPSTGMYWEPRAQQHFAWNVQTQEYVVVPPSSSTAAGASTDASSTAGLINPPPSAIAASTDPPAASAPPKVPIRLSLPAALAAKLQARATPVPHTALAAVFASAAEESPAPPQQTSATPAAGAPSVSASMAPVVAQPPVASSPTALASAAPATIASSATASSAAAEAEDVDPALLSAHFDVLRRACLLCQRGFASLAQLKRHVEQSQLHASNLSAHSAMEEAQRQSAEEQPGLSFVPAPPSSVASPPPAAASPIVVPSPPPMAPSSEIDPSEVVGLSVAERLMLKQGWRGAGHGLGKSEQGIKASLHVSGMQSRAGIGSGSSINLQVAEPITRRAAVVEHTETAVPGTLGYKESIRRKALERFEAVQHNEDADASLLQGHADAEQREHAREYLFLLERARAMTSESAEHRRPLMK